MTTPNSPPVVDEFEPDIVMGLLRRAVAGLPAPSMFELRNRGYASLFQQIVGCLISVRTYEEVSLPAALRLFARAADPRSMTSLPAEEIDNAIRPATFHTRKSVQILEIAQLAIDRFDGAIPCDERTLLGLPGIGPKCTALALGIACGQARLPVDIHVHRIANRWGIIATSTPEQTQAALEAIFPDRDWLELNERLVPFGKSICTRLRPRCSTCFVRRYCRQVGVVDPR